MSWENGGLPKGWIRVRLGDITSPSPEKVEPGYWADEPYLSLEHIESGTRRILGRGTGADASSTKSRFRAGDVLYGKLRPYLNKACIPDFDGICSTDILVFPQNQAVHNGFLLYLLSRPEAVEYATQNASGINLPRISFEKLSELEVDFPPLAEQRRITAQLERLQARIYHSREALKVIPPLLEEFRQSVLAAAFRGDLTADWRARNTDAEPASVLLERIRAERRRQREATGLARIKAKGKDAKNDRWKQRHDEPAPVDASELPELPAEWTWVTLDHLTQGHRKISYGVLKPGAHVPAGVRFIKSGQVRDGYVDLEDDYRISAELDEQYWRTRLEGGEVLLNLVGASIGRSAVAPLELAGANVTRAIAVIPTFSEVAQWAQLALQGPVGQRLVHSAVGGSAQPVLNLSEVRKLPIPLPPRVELEEVVRRINRAQQRLRTILRATEEAQSRIDQLDQSILAKAFRGELVQQDPNDEPASMLLVRLRAKIPLDTRTRSRTHMRKQATAPSTKKRRPVLEVISSSREPLTPEVLFARCGYDPAIIEDIEGFFSELRELDRRGELEDQRPDKATILLRAVR